MDIEINELLATTSQQFSNFHKEKCFVIIEITAYLFIPPAVLLQFILYCNVNLIKLRGSFAL